MLLLLTPLCINFQWTSGSQSLFSKRVRYSYPVRSMMSTTNIIDIQSKWCFEFICYFLLYHYRFFCTRIHELVYQVQFWVGEAFETKFILSLKEFNEQNSL